MNDEKSKRQQDRDLDDQLEDSFPASDPPSSSTPGTSPGAPDHDGDGKPKGGVAHGDRPADPGRLKRGSGGMPIRSS